MSMYVWFCLCMRQSPCGIESGAEFVLHCTVPTEVVVPEYWSPKKQKNGLASLERFRNIHIQSTYYVLHILFSAFWDCTGLGSWRVYVCRGCVCTECILYCIVTVHTYGVRVHTYSYCTYIKPYHVYLGTCSLR